MLLLNIITLVLTISLASLLFINNLNYRIAFLIFLYSYVLYDSLLHIEILGGLFQLTLLIPFNFTSNNEESKNFWINIKPISEWYNLGKDGNSSFYINKFNDQKGIYVYRLIKEPWKCYVGSAESLSKRLISHRWAFTNFINTGNSSVPLFYNAIKKHGWGSFEIAVLEIVPIAELANRENYYLSFKPYYLSFKPYYNLKYFINGKIQHSDEVRAQISLSVLGKDNPFFGKTHSEESKLKMISTKFLSKDQFGGLDYSKALVISRKSSITKSIYQISKDKKELINTFPSLNVTALYFKSARDTIRKYLDSGILFGDNWFLTTNISKDLKEGTYIIKDSALDKSILTPVYQYLIDKESIRLINIFPSIANTALYFEVSPITIRRYIKSQKIFKDKYLLSTDNSLDNSSPSESGTI